jgi:DNA-directed RNA polymerase specialized sigma24 family protein
MDARIEGSVTRAFGRLKDGDPGAVHELWERYFSLLVALARRRLQNQRRLVVADEEDAVLSAFNSFQRRARRGDFPDIMDRDDLWVKLAGLTTQKIIDLRRQQDAVKRDSRRTEPDYELALHIDDGPDPETVAIWTDEIRHRLGQLGDDRLREVAVMKMGGHTGEEIARRFGMSLAWVNRRLREIRRIWDAPDAGGPGT